MVITGLQHHNGAQKIVLKRLGCNKNITVTMNRKDGGGNLTETIVENKTATNELKNKIKL